MHQGKVNSLAWNGLTSQLISAGTDKQWIIWNPPEKTPLQVIEAHAGPITVIRCSPNGRWIATGSQDRTVQIWDAATRKRLDVLTGHTQAITDLAFHPESSILASASADQTIRLWKLSNEGKATLLHRLDGHTFVVSHLLFSKDGKILISGSKDKTVRLWDVEKGTFLRILSGETSPISAMALRSDGTQIAVGTLQGRIVLLRYPLALTSPEQSHPSLPTESSLEKGIPQKSTPLKIESIVPKEEIDHTSLDPTPKSTGTELYLNLPQENKKFKLLTLQQQLNDLLKQKRFCHNQSSLKSLAWDILKDQPNDQAAYHALLKVAVIQQDLSLILLVTQLGQRSVFFEKIYDYSPILQIQSDWDYWQNEIFDGSFLRRQKPLSLTLKTCEEALVPMPFPLLLTQLAFSEEFWKVLISGKIPLDLEGFEKQDPLHLAEKLFQISSVMNAAEERGTTTLALKTGLLRLNLENLQDWGDAHQISFYLKEGEGPWQTYKTDRDQRKDITLPVGEYYLKTKEYVDKAFQIQEGTTVVIDL